LLHWWRYFVEQGFLGWPALAELAAAAAKIDIGQNS
jgi:hypothetical protein